MPQDYRVEKWTGDCAPFASELKQRMESEGYRVFQWSNAPGTAYSRHVHEDDQSHWIVSGMLELDVTNVGVVRLSPGDRDFMPAGTYHSARVVSEEPVVYLVGEKL